jgi:hypothetical protein
MCWILDVPKLHESTWHALRIELQDPIRRSIYAALNLMGSELMTFYRVSTALRNRQPKQSLVTCGRTRQSFAANRSSLLDSIQSHPTSTRDNLLQTSMQPDRIQFSAATRRMLSTNC